MDTRRVLDDSVGPSSLSATFNSDESYFAVGLETGFCVYNSEKCEVFRARELGGGIGLAEIRDRSDCIALVGGGKQPKYPPNKVVIWNDSKQQALMKLEFRTPVQRVRLSRTHIIAVLLNSINMYTFASPPVKLAEFETANNPFGLCCLGKKIFAFPGRTLGQVQLVELATRNVSIIPAHTTPLRALAISPDGEFLATASENGTLIRVWSASNCSRLAELRRGVDPATIFSISISPSSTLLAVTSDKSTLHIFDLPRMNVPPTQRPYSPRSSSSFDTATSNNPDAIKTQKWGVLGKIPLMPRVFSDLYSFASAHFEIGDEPVTWQSGKSPTRNAPIPGVPGGRPPKGLIGWVSDDELVVVGTGKDSRWERFRIGVTEDGRRVCYRDGWKGYLD